MYLFDARTATDHFPGIGRYVSNLTRALAAIKDIAPQHLTLLTPPASAAQRFALPALPQVPCAASPFALPQQWQVPAILRRLGATLYHSAYYLMPYAPGVPTVCTFYDLIPLLHPEYFRPVQRLIYRLTHALALHCAQRALAISHITRRDLLQVFRVPPEKIVVTPLAADPQLVPQPAAVIAALRQRYHLPDTYGLYVGSNKPHKNLPLLVQAYAQTQRTTPLVIAGHWDARYPEAKALTEKLNLQSHVFWLGPVPESALPALFSGAAWFVFPSRYEGFGLPPLEAMACGAPTLCADIPVLREVAADAALYFDPARAATLVNALQQAQTDAELLADLRQRALTRAQTFSWETTARQTWAVYQQLSPLHS